MLHELLLLSAGTCIGLVFTALVAANKIREQQNLIDAYDGFDTCLTLLRARIRAIQDNGKPIGKGERLYVVQKPNGKFAKFTLPEV